MKEQTKKLPAARQEQILDWLQDEGILSIQELQSRFDISHMTVHRDIDRMASQHLVKKVRGGVMHIAERTPPTRKRCSMCSSRVSTRTEVVIQKQDGTQMFACCPHCGIMLVADGADIESALARDFIYGRMVNIFQAAYVIESEVRLCCVPSTLCFGSKSTAERFQRGFEGQILDFSTLLKYLAATHYHQ